MVVGLRLLLVLALLLAAVTTRAEAQGNACPPHAQPRVRVPVVDPEPVLITHLDMAALHAETGRPRHAQSHHLGLTTSAVEWHSDIDVRYSSHPGGVCAVVAELVLTLVQAEHILRIASEIPHGGCLFRQVEAHEMRHVAINRATLRQAASRARAAALHWAAQAEARAQTVDEAMALLQQGLRRAIAPAMAEMDSQREAGHRLIDTPEEYRRLSRICQEDQRALRARLRGVGLD